jgi:hypothetical protein
MKKFKVVAKGLVMDAEVNCNDYAYDARHYYDEFIKSGFYSQVYIMDNETGEVYDTYDRSIECGGMKIVVWSKF